MATHTTVRFDPASRLEGELTPPADKSISHRAAIFGAMGDAPVRVRNYLVAADTTSSLNAVRALGASVEDGARRAHDPRRRAARRARSRTRPIDVGNAGTLMRLLPGWLAAQDGRAFDLDGDDSIRRRPVDRIATPLRQMGATIDARDGRLPPFTVTGGRCAASRTCCRSRARRSSPRVALAALSADGPTTIVEPEPSRDHTERMLAAAGVDVRRAGAAVTIAPADALALGAELDRAGRPVLGRVRGRRRAARARARGSSSAARARTGRAPASSASPSAWAAGSRAPLEDAPGEAIPHGDPIGDLEVARRPARRPPRSRPARSRSPSTSCRSSRCSAASPRARPIVRGAAELRVKETDRIATVVEGLRGLGAEHRGHRRRLRRPTAPAACAAGRSPRTATTASRCSAPSPASRRARGSRSRAWTRRRSATPRSRPTSASLVK